MRQNLIVDRRRFVLAGLGLTAAAPAFGQLSPPKTASAAFGGKKITVDYYAPSMRGRKIFGSLVPYNEVWCTGANWTTVINSPEAGLQIGALRLPKGSYAIWTLPTEKEWTLIVNSNTKAFHTDYNPRNDIGRTKMNVKMLDAPVEQFRIELRPESGNRGTLALLWEKTEASIPIVVE
jgi:hypothetical protein